MWSLRPFKNEVAVSKLLQTGATKSYPQEGTPTIELQQVHKTYPMGRRQYQALRGVDLQIGSGEFVAIVGPSGSGKSTILNMITGIDRPSQGTVLVGGQSLNRLSENQMARWRGVQIGIVFQFFQLLPTLTALENVMLPLHLRGRAAKVQGEARRGLALEHLEMVGMHHHAHHLPGELSGGEQQRVAIARALANDPPIIVADEPTGNLDTHTGEIVFDIFSRLSSEGKTVIYVTHDNDLAQRAGRLIQVRDGLIVADSRVDDVPEHSPIAL